MRHADAPAAPELWEALLEHRQRALRVARARCPSPQDAEDCVQEAMVRVACMPHVDLARLGPLLTTVVANLAADGHRSSARKARALPRMRAAAAHSPGHEDAVCDALEAQWLWSRRGELAEQDRAVLELRAAGRTAGQAAHDLGVTYKAAESSFTRARARMRAIWRAAAAALGVLSARPAGDPRHASAALLTTAAATAACLTLLPGPPPGADAAESPARPPTYEAGASVHRLRTATPPTGPLPFPASSPPAGRPASAGPPPPAATAAIVLADVPPVRAGDLAGGGGRVNRERQDESLEETVRRCLTHGVVVGPYAVDCRG